MAKWLFGMNVLRFPLQKWASIDPGDPLDVDEGMVDDDMTPRVSCCRMLPNVPT